MQGVLHTKIQIAKTQIESFEHRRNALDKLLKTVQKESAFTTEECGAISYQIDMLNQEIESQQNAIFEDTHYLNTTVKTSEAKLKRREEVLNTLFASEDMTEHTDLMSVFLQEHRELQAIVSTTEASDFGEHNKNDIDSPVE